MAENIEKKVAQTILQQPTEVRVGDKTYSVAPPSVATIIMVSQYVALLPAIKMNKDTLIEEILANAKECAALGDIAAVLLLGAKNCNEVVERRSVVREPRFFGLFHRNREVVVTEVLDRKAIVAKEILENLSATELYKLVMQILSTLQLADFFGLTTFLCEINLTKPTKVD